MTLIGKLQNHDTRTSSTNKMSNAFVNHHAIIHFGKSFFFFLLSANTFWQISGILLEVVFAVVHYKQFFPNVYI